MAGDVLIVDITDESIHTLVLSPDSGETRSRAYETPMSEGLPEAMTTLLDDMEMEGFKDFSRVILGLWPSSASLRVITLPFTEKSKVEDVLPFELSDSFIGRVEEYVIGSLPLVGNRTLAVSVEKRVVERAIESFEALGIAPSFIGLSLLYKDRLLRTLHGDEGGGTAALIDNTSIVVIRDLEPALYSYISGPMDLKFALAALESDGIKVERFYSTRKALGWLEALDPKSAQDAVSYTDAEIGTRALSSLYMEGLEKDPMNLRKGQFVDKRVFESTKRSFRIATVLIVLLTFFWGANIFSRLSSTDTELVKVEAALGSAYQELFTDESAVDPFYQMEIKLKELSEEKAFVGGGIDVLEIFKGLSRGAGAIGTDDKLRLFEIKMHSERVVARGETRSFDSADKFKDTLLAMPGFKDISLTDVKKNSTGGVSFSIALTLEGEG